MGPQLPEAVASAVKSGTAAWQLPSVEAVLFAPQVIVGAVQAFTLIGRDPPTVDTDWFVFEGGLLLLVAGVVETRYVPVAQLGVVLN
jgi:hypothetical protein